MSNDLISRSELIKDLMEQIPLAENVYIFKDIIESQPTAYDVDKVVEQLKGKVYLNCYEPVNLGYNKAIMEAIKIVKRGGINETD